MTLTRAGLDRLLAPRSIALVGASSDPEKFGGRPLAALRRHGYEGEILAVNPAHHELQGVPCVPSPRDLPEGIDLAVILLPADGVVPALRACAERGVGAAAVFGGGFRETGAPGAARERELAAAARDAGIRLLGPNCPGFVNLRTRTACSSSAFATREEMFPGPIAFVLGSGAVAGILCDRAFDRGIGVGAAVCTGNAADVDVPDVLRHLVADGETRAIGVFLEGLGDGTRLMEALREAREADVGVAVLKVGRTGAGRWVVASHTGALVGSDTAFDAMCAGLGVVRVDDYDDLLETTHLLATAPRPGRHLAVVGASGGMNAALADAAEANGLALPPLAADTVAAIGDIVPDFGAAMNPVDISSAVMLEPGRLGRALEAVAGDPAVDGVVVVVGDHPPRLSELLADGISRAAARLDGRVVAQWSAGRLSERGMTRLNRDGIPVFESPERCMAAIARAMRAGEADPSVRAAAVAPTVDAPLSESRAKDVLASALIPTPRRVAAETPAALASALEGAELGDPIVVKADCVGAVHKAELGAVRVGVPRAHAAVAAREVWDAARAALGARRVTGVLAEELVRPLAEVIVSVHRDPHAGPLVTVGAGGALVEVLRDSVSRLAPVTAAEAAEMIAGLRCAPLLRGGRGAPSSDLDAVARAVARLSELGAAAGERVSLIEVNPLAALAEGTCALDAVIDGPGR
jgi:acyl-CoA synthetase (NDP forming)